MAWHMCALVLLLTSTASLVSATLAADSLVTIPVHNVAAPMVKASTHNVGAAALAATHAAAIPQDTRLKLVVSLKSKDPKGLDRRARAVMDPYHSLYQQYLNPSQFGRAFGASTQAVSSVRGYLTAQGLSVQLQPNRLTLEVSGTAAQVSKAFNIKLVQVQSQQLLDASSRAAAAAAATAAAALGTSTGKLLRAPVAHPQVPAHIAPHIKSVRGLDNLPVVSPASTAARQAAGSAGSRKRRSLLHQPDDNAYFLTVDRIRKLYNLPTDAFDGEGEAIALASFEKFEIGAVEEYALANGLIEEGDSLSNIIERFLSDPDSVGGSSNPDATHVDLEMLLSASPKAKITVYLAENSEAGEALLMSKIANLNTSSIVLYTWGREEQPGDVDGTINTLLKQMVLQGQSVVVASGSCGVHPQTRNATCDELTEGVNFPASSEFVTAVGGTTPTLFIGNTWAKEVAWELSSGGVSRYMPLPQYQADVTTLVNRQHRNLPDVALAADPDVWPYEVYVPNEANEFSTVGGTAPAASVWAGYFALINQCRKARELAPARLGAANGQLYAIGNTKWQADKAFRSCSEGSNGKFDAGAGWDAVTGWNSMNGKMMTGFLCPGYMGACCYRTKYGNSYCVELTEENCDTSKGGTFTDGKVCTPGTPMTLSNC